VNPARASMAVQLVIVALLVVIAFESMSPRQASSPTTSGVSTDTSNLQTEIQGLRQDVQAGNALLREICANTTVGHQYTGNPCQ